MNEEGRKQQNQLRELTNLASTFDCTIAQLAIGKSFNDLLSLSSRTNLRLAWCLKNDNVHCVLLGATSVEQLHENINALNVNFLFLNDDKFDWFLFSDR